MNSYKGCDLRMKNSPGFLEAIPASRLRDVPAPAAVPAASSTGVQVLRGREAVAAKAQMLHDLCRRTGQADAMHWLEYLLTTPTALEKLPALVLVGHDPEMDPAHATADDLSGAVLLYEYQIAGR